MGIYSQNDEQQIIESYFGNLVGTFCDCGSNDGITLSNVYNLALKHWSGILIEPSEEAFNRLSINYDNFNHMRLFNCAATGLYDGEVDFFESGEHLGKGDVSLLSTVHEHELQRWRDSTNTFIKKTVPAVPINKILGLSGFKTIDFFSIDVEGSEIDILQVINFKKWNTQMVCVEWNSKNKHSYDHIMLSQGFRLINKNSENLIYAI